MTTQPLMLTPPRAARRPAVAFPLVLIALGVMFLLANAGYVTSGALLRLVSLWPVALLLVGSELLLRDRSTIALVLVEVGIIGACVAYAVAGPVTVSPIGSRTTTVGRDGAQSLALVVNYGAGKLAIHGGTNALVEVASSREDVRVASVQHVGSAAAVTVSSSADNDFFFAGPDRSWDVAIPTDLPLTLTLNVGAGTFDIDLHQVMLRSARISNGASDLTLRLPTAAGDVPVNLSTGASSVTFEIPAGVQYRVRTTGGLNTVNGLDETSGYAAAADRYTIVVSAGASTVTIR
jgi:uncharacterized protein DUF2154